MNKFMRMAIKEAEKGIIKNDGGPFGTVIVRDNKVIAKAHNEVVKKSDPTCHGEMEAIRKACKKLNSFDLSNCELYTTGEPCPMCLGAILWANIDKVYYGCNINDTKIIGFRDSLFYDKFKTKDIINELDREACLKLYEKYKNLDNRTNY